MTNGQLNAPRWISTVPAFNVMLEEVRKASILAVDTESNSLFAYNERVCLLQLSTRKTDYLIDPLALDIRLLGELFASPVIEKVFHAAEYDIICLRRGYHFQFTNIFDTMVATRLLKKPALGLASILQDEFDVIVDKKHQRANWGERPIKPAMLEYARMDTHYLIPLRERRMEELKAAGLWELAQEDFARVSEVNGSVPEKPNCWSVAGREILPPQQMAVLQGLVEYRDQVARQIDQPVFKVFGNSVLVDLARTMPTNRKKLVEGDVLSERQLRHYGSELLEVIRQSENHPVPRRNHTRRPPEIFLNRYEKLKRWRAVTASEMGLESDAILPKDIMRAIAELREITPEELKLVMSSTPWRYQRYGTRIIDLLNNRINPERKS
ncbi:MAG: HRDC domain-containing protein [Anaerolineaceae bacterium]